MYNFYFKTNNFQGENVIKYSQINIFPTDTEIMTRKIHTFMKDEERSETKKKFNKKNVFVIILFHFAGRKRRECKETYAFYTFAESKCDTLANKRKFIR